jgi:DNA-binding NarL/FixJ family response regulator
MLTPREWEVAQLIAGGLSTSEIALELDISPRTVKDHATRITRKLQLASTTDIGSWARRRQGAPDSAPPPIQITPAGMVW